MWSNYILIGTQWPSDFACACRSELQAAPSPRTDFDKQPDMNCAPAPIFLANSTLETYSQGEIPQASSSCMGCHGNATSYLHPKNTESTFIQPIGLYLHAGKGPLTRVSAIDLSSATIEGLHR